LIQTVSVLNIGHEMVRAKPKDEHRVKTWLITREGRGENEVGKMGVNARARPER
jgi:hypothetical protein